MLQTELSEELVKWIRGGFPVRTDPNDPFSGRCGAKVTVGGGGRSSMCRLAAGWGTEHKGVGRCKKHPLTTHFAGLHPWVGQLTREQWLEMTGATEEVGVTTHGATEIGTLPLEDLFARHMDTEDRSVLHHAYTDPHQLIDFVLKLRQVALGRLNRELHRLRIQHAGHVPASKSVAIESLANQVSSTIARLLEAKGKFLEVESGNETRGLLAGVLRGLSDEDFNALKGDPAAMAKLMASTNT